MPILQLQDLSDRSRSAKREERQENVLQHQLALPAALPFALFLYIYIDSRRAAAEGEAIAIALAATYCSSSRCRCCCWSGPPCLFSLIILHVVRRRRRRSTFLPANNNEIGAGAGGEIRRDLLTMRRDDQRTLNYMEREGRKKKEIPLRSSAGDC